VLVEERDHAPVAASDVADVRLGAHRRGLADRLAKAAGEQRVRVQGRSRRASTPT
jgi:hypothetical protein